MLTCRAATVLAYLKAYHDRAGGGGFSLMLAVVLGLFFFGIVRGYLRRSPRAEWLAAVGFGGGVVLGVSAMLKAGVDFGFGCHGVTVERARGPGTQRLGERRHWIHGRSGSCHTHARLRNRMFRSRLMPRWLGWATIIIGVFAVLGPLITLAFWLAGVWVLVMSYLLFVRDAAGLSPTDAEALGVADV